MQYPPDFPPESCSRVTAARLRAGKDFEDVRENLRSMPGGATIRLAAELRRCILREFAVFVSEAGKLGYQGIWSVDRLEKEALEFLRLSTIDAGFSKGFDLLGRSFGRDWIDNWGHIKSRVMREFESSDEWRQYQDALLQVAEYPATGRSAPELPEPIATHKSDRHALVDAFLLRCNQCTTELAPGSKVVKKHIWMAVGHTHPRQFQYWQSGSEEATEEDNRNFLRIMRMLPGEFLALLKKKGISTSNS